MKKDRLMGKFKCGEEYKHDRNVFFEKIFSVFDDGISDECRVFELYVRGLLSRKDKIPFVRLYQMPDGRNILKWSLLNNYDAAMYVYKNLGMDIKMVFQDYMDLFEWDEIKSFINSTPKETVILTKEQSQIILNAFSRDLPDDVNYHHGLDGFHVLFRYHSHIYESWCAFPDEWADMADAINMMLGIVCPDGFRLYS